MEAMRIFHTYRTQEDFRERYRGKLFRRHLSSGAVLFPWTIPSVVHGATKREGGRSEGDIDFG